MAISIIAEWRTALVVFVVVSAICIGYVFTLKPQFVATATFLPQEGHSQADAFASIFSMRGPGGLYIGLLKSRSVQDDMISRLGLMKLWNLNSQESARNQLAGKSSFTENSDGIVTISIRDSSAQEAATIANGYLDALVRSTAAWAPIKPARRASSSRQNLLKKRANSTRPTLSLKRRSARPASFSPKRRPGLGINAIAGIRSQITNLQVQLAALLQSETESNPQVKALRASIAQLQVEETEMEQGGRNPAWRCPADAESALDQS